MQNVSFGKISLEVIKNMDKCLIEGAQAFHSGNKVSAKTAELMKDSLQLLHKNAQEPDIVSQSWVNHVNKFIKPHQQRFEIFLKTFPDDVQEMFKKIQEKLG